MRELEEKICPKNNTRFLLKIHLHKNMDLIDFLEI